MSDQEGRRTETSPAARPRPPPNRRRDKAQLSCNLCRRRKRGLESQCKFVAGDAAAHLERRASACTKPVDVQERLRQLEDQIDTMMHRRASSETRHETVSLPTPAESGESMGTATPTDRSPDTFAGTSLTDCSSWSSILRELRAGSTSFDCTQKLRASPPATNMQSPGPLLLYGCTPVTSFDELLASIPSRPLTNRLVSNFFNGLDLSSAFIHGPEFLKEYNNFWNDPKRASPFWLAILYAVLCTSIQFQKANPEIAMLSVESLDASLAHFREKIVQCLMFGRYTNGGPYAIQALLHYVIVELFSTPDANTGLWVISGIVVNMANRMGYDRDPMHLPNISPYEAEMRRRLWRSLAVMDSAISESVGAQRFISNVDSVPEPRNLLDSDFDATTALEVFGQVTDLVAGNRPCAYSEVMKVDSILTAAHSGMPACYKWRTFAQSITDPSQIICRRMFLEIVYLKARVVLHLKYVGPSKDQDRDRYAYSHKTIFNSISRLLDFHHICDEETQPTGQLFSVRWRYLIAVHQNFLLASIAACFFLEYNRSTMNAVDLAEFEKLCRRSQGIWIRTSRSSTEAAKAAEALRISLDNMDSTNVSSEPSVEHQQPMNTDLTLDSWSNNYLPDYFGGFDLPFSYFGLFDGLSVPPPIPDVPDTPLVPPVTGQSAECLISGSWDPTPGV
ncbi:fungal specific transcription factor [Seiridium cupressi]